MAISKEDILEAVASMTVMELNDLVKAFEEVRRVRGLGGGGRSGATCRRRPGGRADRIHVVVLAEPAPAPRRSRSSRSSVPPPAWA